MSRLDLRGILAGGVIAGILDITYAIVVLHDRGKSALWTLQSVASGIQGNAAFEGGTASGVLGLAAHFTIAIVAAFGYWLIARQSEAIRRHPVSSGLVYGIVIYLVMNFVVLPLSAYPFHPKYPIAVLAKGSFFHAVLIGLPIALCVRGRQRD